METTSSRRRIGSWRRRSLAALVVGGTIAGMVALGGQSATQKLTASTAVRGAVLIGARADNWAQGNSTIGPLQTQRVFYKTQLPASFIGSEGDKLPTGIVVIVSYKTMNTNVVGFVKSIPANRRVIMSFHHEPEGGTGNGDFPNGPTFVSDFDSQSALIRSAHKSNVQVAMIAGSYQYEVGTKHDNGGNAAYLPAASEVDMYCVDNYENSPNGSGLATDPEFLGWYNQVKGRGKPLCITEYGLLSDNTAHGNQLRVDTMKADNAWLAAHGPFAIWEYWWTNSYCGGCNPSYMFTDAASIAEWKAIEGGKSTGPTPTPTPKPTATPKPTPKPTPTPTPKPVAAFLALSPSTLNDNGSNSTVISFHLNIDATVTLSVHNSKGAVVRTVLDAESKAAGDRSQAFYGFDGSGKRLPAGHYTVTLSASAQGHTTTLTAALTLTQ